MPASGIMIVSRPQVRSEPGDTHSDNRLWSERDRLMWAGFTAEHVS